MRKFWNVIYVLVVIGEVCCYPPSPCSLCPPGTFLKDMCSPDVDTRCLPCDERTFSATASHLKQCSACSECPEGMYVHKPCDTITDTECSPCSSIPPVKSDYFEASCELRNSEGTRTDIDSMMMADAPEDVENADTASNQAAGADLVDHEGENKDTEGKESHQDNRDPDNSHTNAENTKEVNKETLQNSSTSPSISIKDLDLPVDPVDKSMNDNRQFKTNTNEAKSDEGQSTSNQDNVLSENAETIPFPVKEEELKETTDSKVLSAQESSFLDEVRLRAVKANDNEEETNGKRYMNDAYNQTTFVPNEDESRLSDNVVRNDQMNNTDREMYEGTQADAPVESQAAKEEAGALNIDTSSDNKTEHHADNSSDVVDGVYGVKPDSSHIPKEDSEGRKRAAIILGVAIAGMTFFTLLFFASRCCKGRRRKFKDMKKVNSYDQESGEIEPLSYTPTGSHQDPDPQTTNGLYRQGPPVGPSSSRTTQPKVEQTQPTEVQVAPETKMTIPILTVSAAPDDVPPEDLPESLSDHEPLVGDVGKLKYIDESTDDEYVMTILNKIPFCRLSHVVEEPQFTLPSTQGT